MEPWLSFLLTLLASEPTLKASPAPDSDQRTVGSSPTLESPSDGRAPTDELAPSADQGVDAGASADPSTDEGNGEGEHRETEDTHSTAERAPAAASRRSGSDEHEVSDTTPQADVDHHLERDTGGDDHRRSDASRVAEQRDSGSPSRPWRIGGFVDVAYLVNSNLPDNHLYRGTVTTPRTGELTVNLGVAYVQHEPIELEPWRLEFGLQVGAAADALYSAEPIAGEAEGRFAGSEAWKHLALANVGGKILRSGTEIGAGLFASPIGIGGFWSPFNWNYSPSWESNAAPFYLAGARVIQELPAGFGLQGWVINGWQTIGDVNKAPSYLTGLTWGRAGRRGDWNAAQFVYFGPDDVDLAPRAWRVHSDTQATWEGKRVGVGAVWDYGQEQVTSLPGSPTHRWTGGGLFVHGLAYDGQRVDLDFAARPDAWYDSGGRIYGVPQWLLSGTGTTNIRLFDALLARVEYRFDRSTADRGFFYAGQRTSDGSPSLANSQHTVFFSVAGYFEYALGARRGAD